MEALALVSTTALFCHVTYSVRVKPESPRVFAFDHDPWATRGKLCLLATTEDYRECLLDTHLHNIFSFTSKTMVCFLFLSDCVCLIVRVCFVVVVVVCVCVSVVRFVCVFVLCCARCVCVLVF